MQYRRTGKRGEKKYMVTAKYSRRLLSCMNDLLGNIQRGGKTPVVVKAGRITIQKGHTWNGANWFPDLKCTQEATLVHDALCQLLGQRELDRDLRKCADQQLYCMVKDSCSPWLAAVMYNAIRGNQRAGLPVGLLGGLWGAIKGLFGEENFQCECIKELRV